MEVDMLMLVLIIALLLLIVCTLFGFLWYSGLFFSVEIKTCRPPFKELEVAYKFAKGSYKDCGALFNEVHSISPDLRCIGLYYDDPAEVGDKPMRYIVGLILNDEGRQATEETKKILSLKGFSTFLLPAVEHVVYATFPHKSVISVLLAINRVIPAFRDYIKEKKLSAYPLIEIYNGDEIIYTAPLSKQDEFFVLEAMVDSEDEGTTDQKTVDDNSDHSAKEVEDPNTVSSVDSLLEGSSKADLPSVEIIDGAGDNDKGLTNGSEASTESFEELQMDS